MEKNMIMVKIFLVVLSVYVSLVMTPCVDAAYRRTEIHVVGDYLNGWELEANNNLNKDWASEREFYTGDWLFFGFDTKLYSVLVVNETDYKNCRSVHPIQNITGVAGQVLFNLSSSQTYFFISGGGVCSSGMKLAVVVIDTAFYQDDAPPADEEAPSPPRNVCVCGDSGRNTVLMTFVSFLFLLYLLYLLMF